MKIRLGDLRKIIKEVAEGMNAAQVPNELGGWVKEMSHMSPEEMQSAAELWDKLCGLASELHAEKQYAVGPADVEGLVDEASMLGLDAMLTFHLRKLVNMFRSGGACPAGPDMLAAAEVEAERRSRPREYPPVSTGEMDPYKNAPYLPNSGARYVGD
jgi:hypothetical protein